MTEHARVEICVSRHFKATPEQVFDAWLDPNHVGNWLFATPTGQMVRVEIEARVGGHFILVDRRDGEDVEHVGEYLKIQRPQRLAFSFAVPKYSKEATQVHVDLAPVATGCELTLTHQGVYAEYAERTQQGWSNILDGLAKTIE